MSHLLHDGGDDVALFCCAEYEIDSGSGKDFLRFELGIAACDDYKSPRMLLDEFVDGLPAFVVSHFGDGTCVDHADVGNLALLRLDHTIVLELLCYGRGFSEVEFAAEREVSCLLALQYA